MSYHTPTAQTLNILFSEGNLTVHGRVVGPYGSVAKGAAGCGPAAQLPG